MAEYLVARLSSRHKRGEPIASVTAYDYCTARLAAEAGMDFVLVGDSLGNVIHGADTTVGVTLDEVVYHTRIVARHFPSERVVLDLPLGPYLADPVQTAAACIDAFKRSGCGAVKLEGAHPAALHAIELLHSTGIPVVAHIGLQPQSVHVKGGFRRQGVNVDQHALLLAEAQAVQQAGACAVVLEMVESELALRITAELDIPTIGIGSGGGCDGQILVVHDLLGLLPGKAPSFATQYAQLYEQALEAMNSYIGEVKGRSFGTAASSVPVRKPHAEVAEAAAAPQPEAADNHSAALLADLAGSSQPGGGMPK